MALLNEPVVVEGVIWGSTYTFENVGDELPVHVHDEDTNHITIVAKGSVRCKGRPEIEGKVLGPGTVIDWKVGLPHGFDALEPDTKMVQILKK